MALHWRPVGPEPAQTYWRRRAVVAGLALLLLVLLVVVLLRLGDDPERLQQQPGPVPTSRAPSSTPEPSGSPNADPSASGQPSPSGSASPTPTPSASATAAASTDGALDVEAAAEQASYPAGASPRLELRITNTGPTACSRDLGQSAVELVVSSGADRIWSSDDCAPGGDADVTTLEPGAVEVSRVTWPGTRSSPGCDGAQPRARAGTYRVSARVGALREQGETFLLR